jgi:hypothetical protein
MQEVPHFGRCIVRCIRPRWRLSRCSIALQFDIRRGALLSSYRGTASWPMPVAILMPELM